MHCRTLCKLIPPPFPLLAAKSKMLSLTIPLILMVLFFIVYPYYH